MWARIENHQVVEITDIDPSGRFHPSLLWVLLGSSMAQLGWSFHEGTFAPPLIPALGVEQIKKRVTEQRWQVETGGITLPGHIQVATGIDDQNRITSVIANARLAGLDSVSFKAASGWVTLTVSELEGVAAAIALHVQQCFNTERMHHDAIDALAAQHAHDPGALQQALQAYDTSQGWPGA